MKRSIAALAVTTSLVLATGAFAQTLDKVVKVGSLGDQSGLYADIGGPGSTVAAQMAIVPSPSILIAPSSFLRPPRFHGEEVASKRMSTPALWLPLVRPL